MYYAVCATIIIVLFINLLISEMNRRKIKKLDFFAQDMSRKIYALENNKDEIKSQNTKLAKGLEEVSESVGELRNSLSAKVKDQSKPAKIHRKKKGSYIKRQKEILELVRQNPNIAIDGIMQLSNLSRKAVTRHMKIMLADGLLECTKTTMPHLWRVKNGD